MSATNRGGSDSARPRGSDRPRDDVRMRGCTVPQMLLAAIAIACAAWFALDRLFMPKLVGLLSGLGATADAAGPVADLAGWMLARDAWAVIASVLAIILIPLSVLKRWYLPGRWDLRNQIRRRIVATASGGQIFDGDVRVLVRRRGLVYIIRVGISCAALDAPEKRLLLVRVLEACGLAGAELEECEGAGRYDFVARAPSRLHRLLRGRGWL